MRHAHPPLHQLGLNDPLPPPQSAWGAETAAPGLLALGGGLSVQRLLEAYGQACFPWYSEGQTVMWWSPDPRMVLDVTQFRLHRSLRKTLTSALRSGQLSIRIDHDFSSVINACATAPRPDQNGTWIVRDMIRAYEELHRAGYAHSVETWINGELVGGLYCVAIGKAVFGESMFTNQPNASKIALTALVSLCKSQAVRLIDCQQKTAHLASMGAQEIPRLQFLDHIAVASKQTSMVWKFDPLYWNETIP